MYYTYIIKCLDGTLYTGQTGNLQKRYNDHFNGTGARYTRVHGVHYLFYYEQFKTRSEAMRREREIQHLTHQQKLQLRHDGTRF